MLNFSAQSGCYLPVEKMSQLFSDVCSKPLGDLELVAIMFVVSDNNTVAQQDNNHTYFTADIISV